MEYYVTKNDERFGPYDQAAVLKGLEDGSFNDHDLYWCEGMPDWQELSRLRPEASSGITQPPPSPVPSRKKKDKPKEAHPAIVLAALVGMVYWVFFHDSKPKDAAESAKADGLKNASSKHREVVLGKKKGTYTKMTLLKLGSQMLDLGLNRAKVEINFHLGLIAPIPQMYRLQILASDAESEGIFVTVDDNNPLYSKIVDLNPPRNTLVTVWGTVTRFSNSWDSVSIVPDQITFTYN